MIRDFLLFMTNALHMYSTYDNPLAGIFGGSICKVLDGKLCKLAENI